jgi:hypothetical protein
MDDIIDRVASCWESSGTLVDSLSSVELARLSEAPEVSVAYSRLNKAELSLAELATATARGKVSEVCTRRQWRITLIKDYSISDDMVISPFPIILIPFNEESVIKVRSYAVAPEVFSKSRVPESDTPKLVGDYTIGRGGVWATPARGICPSIYEASQGATVLSVNGPTYGAYTHVFDADFRYTGSSFSSEVYTGRVFFSDLMKQAVRGDLRQYIGPDELERITRYIEETVLRPDSLSEEVWPLVQSMSGLDPNAAVRLLRKLGSSEHELAQSARSTLSANGLAVDAQDR